jgi:hypothetical protein
MIRYLWAAFLLLSVTAASAQSGSSVRQSGNVTPQHAPSWTTNGVIQDGGTAADSPITSFGVTSNTTAGICVSSGRATAAGRQQICLGAPLNGPGILSVQNYGTATPQGLSFNINGTLVTLPTGGGDFVFGMGPYAAGGMSCFTGTTAVIQDCGLTASSGTITAGTWAGTTIALTHGGTGATTASAARTNLGLGTMAIQNASGVAVTGGSITGMPNPTVSTDVATKAYVDANASGLFLLAPSTLATAAVLPNSPTYDNGTLGVGATLTAGSNTTLTVDGTAAPLNTVVLVKNQASTFQNGIYTVTQAGSGSVPWILTRATYFDQAAEMQAGSYTFVTNGSANANSSYALQTDVAVVGTDPLVWVLFSAASGTVNSAALDSAFGNTQGNILFRNASAWTVLAPGTSGQTLTSGGAAANVSWTTITSLSSALMDSTFGASQGGVLARFSSTWANAGTGTSGFILTSQGATGVVWSNPASLTVSSAQLDATFGATVGGIMVRSPGGWVNMGVGVAGQVLQSNGATTPSWVNISGLVPGAGAVGSWGVSNCSSGAFNAAGSGILPGGWTVVSQNTTTVQSFDGQAVSVAFCIVQRTS